MNTNEMPYCIGGVGGNPWGKQFHQQYRVYTIEKVALAIPAQIPGGSYLYLEIKRALTAEEALSVIENWKWDIDGETYVIRIRKLTPKECFRLMAFEDDDWQKASEVNSNTQLYKQAGNSIVVTVLERILERIFTKEGKLTWEG